MTSTSLDSQQSTWDAELAHEVRQRLRTRAADVRQCQADRLSRREDYRRARRAAAKADESLSAVIEADGGDDLAQIRAIERLTRAAEAARQAEEEARQHCHLARVRLRRAQDELRAAVRRSMAPAPLFDRPPEPEPEPANGAANGVCGAQGPGDAAEQGLEPLPDEDPVGPHGTDILAAESRYTEQLGPELHEELGADPPLPEGHPWPEWLSDEILDGAHLEQREKKEGQPARLKAFQMDGSWWAVSGITLATDYTAATVLPLVTPREFIARWPGIPGKLEPGVPGTHEEQLQLYTGLRLKVGRKEMIVCPAGEGRTLVRAVSRDA